ncbi:uncharacterized protein LOC106013183 [Aplysia californica]|uniref:Uncharacterized protein LOC106013183 n=1 Tax=Aplysia californica TaxID=6500 RepID=A0ABM1A9Z7_APLCA|nr:uncharacterized protein LOC106013183 [Aplysia californica]XP_012943672.1 uncharacterized protein LOC106013183 [Aplysia californica]
MDHLHCGRSESDEQDSRSFRVHVCWSGGQTRKMLLVLLLVLLMSDSVLGIRSLLPFVGEERRVGLQDRPGCYMDGQHYRFGARWSPLFEPQGVMVCIKCECLQVSRG